MNEKWFSWKLSSACLCKTAERQKWVLIIYHVRWQVYIYQGGSNHPASETSTSLVTCSTALYDQQCTVTWSNYKSCPGWGIISGRLFKVFLLLRIMVYFKPYLKLIYVENIKTVERYQLKSSLRFTSWPRLFYSYFRSVMCAFYGATHLGGLVGLIPILSVFFVNKFKLVLNKFNWFHLILKV